MFFKDPFSYENEFEIRRKSFEMVFETIVADLLNRFLGDYIENLDPKQLNVGIWGGDVVLKNLDLKLTALDNVDLPLKLKSGSLGSLTLKIPWQSLYTDAVLVTIEDLYIVATPNLGIKYDPVKEEKQMQDAKQRELKRLEEQRKAKRKKPDPAGDTFVEKLATQIIKNLQVTVRDIHVRYEDEFTKPKKPFSIGVTLHKLSFQTTDVNWKPGVVREAVNMFYKIVDLDSLAFYWNSGSTLMSNVKRDESKRTLKDMIASKTSKPKDFSYILPPISMSGRLKMNPKPELDRSNYTTPKVSISISLLEVAFMIGKYQFHDILEFLEAQERLRLNAIYRKYRPNLRSYKGRAKAWWHFAMECIFKEQVQRRARNWSWSHIKAHWILVRKYCNAWIEKRTNMIPSIAALQTIKEAETKLDVFNLNIARQKAELYIYQKKLKRVEEQGGFLNYMKRWWGGGGQTTTDDGIGSKFEKALTPEERAKFYGAIDYRQDQKPTAYPKEFVENKVSFSLDKFLIIIDDNISDKKKQEVMSLSLNGVGVEFEQRPSANAIKLITKVKGIVVGGIRPREGPRPEIITKLVVDAEHEKGLPQVLFQFETNPLDGSFDQLIKLHLLPLSLIYNAESINKLIEVFSPPESVRLKRVATAAFAKYEEIKEMTATGFIHALEKRIIIKLDIKILPTLIQIPDRGALERSSNVFIFDLGTTTFSTQRTSKVKANERFLKMTEEEKLKVLRESAYDKFKLEVKSLQMLFARPNDDWRDGRTKPTTPMHFLQPTGLEIVLEKAMLDDLRLPRLRITGEIPGVYFTTSDTRLLDVMSLFLSIPKPPPGPELLSEEEIESMEPDLRTRAKVKTILETAGDEDVPEDEDEAEQEQAAVKPLKPRKEVNNEQVQVEMKIVLKEIALQMSRRDSKNESKPYIAFSLNAIGAKIKMRPLDLRAVVLLGGIKMQHLQYQAPGRTDPLHILRNKQRSSTEKPMLLKLEYTQTNKKISSFASKSGNIEQLVRVFGERLFVILHQEALVDLRAFGTSLQKKLSDLKQKHRPSLPAAESKKSKHEDKTRQASTAGSVPAKAVVAANKKTNVQIADDERIINMKIEATFDEFGVCIITSTYILGDVKVEGLNADVTMRRKTMEVGLCLRSIGIAYPSLHSTYRKILSVAGKEVFRLRYVHHVRSDVEKSKMGINDVDTEVSGTFSEMRFIFLNVWLSDLMAWITPFRETVKEAAERAATAVKEGARHAIAAIQEQELATKLKLNIEIDAPVIVIPQSSKADDALLLDLGKLIVSNHFASVPTRGQRAATFDKMAVSLANIKISRVIIGKDRWTAVAECVILTPVSFQLSLSRNMSYSQFKQKPQTSISGTLPLLKICISSEDYRMIMKTLSGNLAEGTSTTSEKASSHPSHKADETESAKLDTAKETSKTKPTGDVVKMDFVFKIESITAILYDGSPNLKSGLAERFRDRAVAAIGIKSIETMGDIREDGTIRTKVYLARFIVDDKRVNRVGLTRLMDKKGHGPAKNLNMIDVMYKKDASGNQKVEVYLRPFYFFLHPEFLGALKRFLADTKSDGEHNVEDQNKHAAVEHTTTTSQAAAEAKKSVNTMNIRVVIEDPEVMLLEDATKPDTTQAITLRFQANVRIENTPEKSSIIAAVTDLQITAGVYAARRTGGNFKVLSPCDVIFQMDAHVGAGQQIHVKFSSINIRISPIVIRLLSAVSANLTGPAESSADEKQAMMIVVEDIWDQKTVAECNFWFLNEVRKEEGAIEALFTPVEELEFDESKKDQCLIEIEQIELTLEADGTTGNVPLIYLMCNFEADVWEWTKQMSAYSRLAIELWYYNERFNVWEPLLEPVVESDGTRRSWQLEVYVAQHNEYEATDTDVIIQPPKMSIGIVGVDPLQLTVTKSLLDVASDLGNAFSRAANLVEPAKTRALTLDSPWSIWNETGEALEVMDSDAFSPGDEWRGAMPFGCMVDLHCRIQRRHVGAEDEKQQLFLLLRFPRYEEFRQVNVTRAEKRIFALQKSVSADKQRHIVVDTTSQYGNKLVLIRSIIKFVNHLPISLDLSYRDKSGQAVKHFGCADPDGGEAHPPLHAVYTVSGEFFIKPSGKEYRIGRWPIPWRQFKRNADWRRTVVCPSADGQTIKDYFITASIDVEDAYFENTHRKNTKVPCYVIYFNAPTSIRNALPYPLEIAGPGMDTTLLLKGGESVSLCSVVPGGVLNLKVATGWTYELTVQEKFDELTQHTFCSEKTGKQIDLGLRTIRRRGTQEMTLYCPFLMVNKTGRRLEYSVSGKFRPVRRKSSSPFRKSPHPKKRVSKSVSPAKQTRKASSSPKRAKSLSPSKQSKVTSVPKQTPPRSRFTSQSPYEITFRHEPGSDEPMFFSFPGTLFFAKNKMIRLKVNESKWSDKFSVDVVGSAGRVACKVNEEKEYEVGVRVQLSHSGLTKVCTFMPFYMVNNRTNATVEVKQSGVNVERWTQIPRNECIGFWPSRKAKRTEMCCRYAGLGAGKRAESQPFSFTESFESFVTMPNELVGVYVSTHVSDNTIVITLEQYQDGMAPALLINHTEAMDVFYRQKNVGTMYHLPPGRCTLYSWGSVIEKRILMWTCGDAKAVEDDLMKGAVGEIKSKKGVKIYWVSFLSGRQRVLLFTQDLAIATIASNPYELERIDQQFTVSLHSINVSLMNNLIGVEIASVAITSSGVLWEYKRRRYRPFRIKDNKRLEDAFLKYSIDKTADKPTVSRVAIGGKLEVDFEEMKQYRPMITEIRRSYQSGFWMQFMRSRHEKQLHVKVNHVQVDNQLAVCVFPTVFAPMPPAKSVAAESIPKPFIELTFIMLNAEHSNISQIKYFKVLVQEMLLQADKGFLNGIIDMFTNETMITYDVELYAKDVEIFQQKLVDLAAITSSTEQKAYYEYLHFSPMKIHASFSQGGVSGTSEKVVPIRSEVLYLLFKSIGVTLTEFQDVQFRLAYFERKGAFMNRHQLQTAVINHYVNQAIRQSYVLVLGLGIIGNPFGLFRDFSSGVGTFFYEPIEGAIQGPEEFADGLALGLRGLFGGAVGGAARAASRITGTIGKGIAALTLDDEYQKKRQQMLSRKPASVQAGLAQGAKGLAVGFVEGITGVFSKPIQGAKRGGVGGFAKGVGKGVVGLVTRPVSGLVDFASGSLQTVKRLTDIADEVKKIRPARFVDPDKIIRPFLLEKAEGNQLLQEAAKGTTDVYVAHAPITADKKYHCIVTDHRIMVVSKTLGALEVDWQYVWNELAEAPKMTQKGLKVLLKEQKKKFLGMGTKPQGKIVTFWDRRLGEMIAQKAKYAFELAW